MHRIAYKIAHTPTLTRRPLLHNGGAEESPSGSFRAIFSALPASGRRGHTTPSRINIHQNPFWVLSITDTNGNGLLPGGLPRWQDVVRMPRNGGRVVFRSRFWDYPGEFVNHCHILQHEHWGMMQTVEVVADEAETDYTPQPPNFSYPKPTKRQMYDTNGQGCPAPTASRLAQCTIHSKIGYYGIFGEITVMHRICIDKKPDETPHGAPLARLVCWPRPCPRHD